MRQDCAGFTLAGGSSHFFLLSECFSDIYQRFHPFAASTPKLLLICFFSSLTSNLSPMNMYTCSHTHILPADMITERQNQPAEKHTHTHPFVLYVSNPEALLQLQRLPDVPSAGQDITIPTRLFSGFNVLPIHLNLLYLAPGGQIVYKHTFIRTK